MIYEGLKYFISPLLLDIYRLLKSKYLNFGNKKLLKKNKDFYDIYSGQSVHILANGPSLTDRIQSQLAGEKVIVMNDFFRSNFIDSFDIVALCYAEPATSSAYSKDNIIDIIQKTKAKSFWFDISLCNKNLTQFTPNKTINFILPGYEPNLFFGSEIDLSKMTLSYNTTASMAIMVAIYMGFKDISLHGFNHDWLANPDFSKHFYSDKKDITDKWNQFSYHQQIIIVDRIWRIYIKLDKLCCANEIKVLNCTENSFLDVFEKRS